MKISEIKPHNNLVLAKVELLPRINEDGIYFGEQKLATKLNTEFYYGKALKVAEGAKDDNNCPGLKDGDYIVFNQFSGSALPTEEYCKAIYGHDVVAILEDLLDMRPETIKPTNDRILVELVLEKAVNEDGVYLGVQEDPREKQTQAAKVVSLGPNVTLDVKEGDIVYFDPYCGNLILNEDELKLKTVNQFDILFSI